MKRELARVLDAAADGTDYADVRSVDVEALSLSVRGPTVEAIDHSSSLGFGVRILDRGAWGHAAAAWSDSAADRDAVARSAAEVAAASATATQQRIELVDEPVHRDDWRTPIEVDPFTVSLEDKIALLLEAGARMEAVPGVRAGRATMDLFRTRTTLVTSDGSEIEQTIFHAGGGIEASAVADGELQQRSYPGSFRGHFAAGGYEVVTAMDLVGHAEQTAEEAVALLRAPECPDGTSTLVLDGHQVMLQVHESVGHPTELDRVLGMEAAFAGTSFVATGDVGRLRYGSELVNITADATVPGGLGTYGYDDEGVAAQRVDLVRNGILTGFQTSRETAARAGEARSNGMMRADGWENFPLIRMSNINLLPGAGSLEDLVADVDHGIFMATNKSWSIDDKRKNFQFGCEIAWRIRNGKLTTMLKNPRYTGITTDFWASCDAIAGPEAWQMWGTPNCGKGQPGQTMRVGHGTAPARFRNASTGVAR